MKFGKHSFCPFAKNFSKSNKISFQRKSSNFASIYEQICMQLAATDAIIFSAVLAASCMQIEYMWQPQECNSWQNCLLLVYLHTYRTECIVMSHI